MDASTKQWIVLKHDSSTRFHLLIWTLTEIDNCNKTCWARASLVAQLVKNLPAIQENWVRSLDWKDPLEKGKATCSSIVAWRIPWTVQSMGSQRVGHDWVTFTTCWISSYFLGVYNRKGEIIIKDKKVIASKDHTYNSSERRSTVFCSLLTLFLSLFPPFPSSYLPSFP